jgi:hypothetical protein
MTKKSRMGEASLRTTAARAAAPNAAIEATRLLGKWLRVAQGHLPLGMRCSCGTAIGNGSIQAQDFELQILDYLFGKHGNPAAESLLAMLRERAGYRPGEAGSITQLLRAIATGAPEPEAELQLALLRDLDRSIDSFDEFHRS